EQGLPGGPGELSFGHGVSCVGASWDWDHLAGSDQETLLSNTVRPLSCCGVFRGNYCLEAANVALFFANASWYESIGVAHSRDCYRNVWEPIEAGNPELWNEFKSNDINALIDELVQYKKAHYPDDQRRILTCGISDGNIRVEWLKAAAPGVDARWEMQLYGLVRMGDCEQAIRFLQETRGMSNKQAPKRVAGVAVELGIDRKS